MNPNEAIIWLPLIQALSEGKLQALCTDGTWGSCSHINFNTRECLYRIRPEPKYGPYRMIDEIPIGKIVKCKKNSHIGMITGARIAVAGSLAGSVLVSLGAGSQQTLESLFAYYTYLDGTPCGVAS